MIRGRRLPRSRRAAFTLLEMVIAMGTLAVVLGAVGMFQKRSAMQSRASLARERAETHARRALDRAAEELRGVGRLLLNPDPTSVLGTSTINYQKPAGVTNAGTIVWGTPSRLRLELEPGETNNGTDDDGDELVDERRLVLFREVGTGDERAVVLCTGISELAGGELANGLDDDGDGLIDEPGFSVFRVGDLLTLQITALVAVRDGTIATSSMSTSVVLRN